MLSQAIAQWLRNTLQETDPDRLRSSVYLAQAIFGSLIVAGFWWFRSRDKVSGFRARESELRKKVASFRSSDELAQARIKPRSEPLRLSGISLQGAPHEILGISVSASEGEIQKAYRELMKRYHPDIVGRPGTREWQDAQKIAEALNRSKDQMLARKKTTKP